ncbi:hypothetical protein MNR01_10665 [Lysobacter sp. S4-A87]|uniref:hypothetical protein n=1 Tax=Lysobacter sp. S4-A87 TaxID=2925843 RepID=UPI001F52F264|nr:hypothetical protein [Lysobacter sp. S4-A87]UNK48236.1 hypothetical protein MNR01_10665 [Lysobacter sp. S4-A87]
MTSPLDDPGFLPFKLDLVGRRVLFLRLDAAQRRDAAFLDDRALPANADGGWVPLEAVLTRDMAVATAADAIFHIGHCGSTLLSRLLDSWPQMQGLREPLPLRTLAEAWPGLEEPQSRLSPAQAPQLLRALWSRWSQPLPPQTRSVVKATSSCNGLIAPLLDWQPTMRAVLLDMPLRPYLATLLKSPASVLDAASAAGERLRDLHARGIADGIALHALGLPQQCAMGWLAERVRFNAIARGDNAARVLRMDFDALLAQPREQLQRLAAHLDLEPSGLDNAMASPAWGRYSKAQAHGYSRDDRAHDLALAMQRHGAEIAEGEAWVETLLQRHPQLRDITAA